MLIPVLLAGGVGTRLWPVSRRLFPKQFLKLVDNQRSLLEQTLARTTGLPDLGPSITICNEEHRFIVAEQLRHMEQRKASIILEPQGKNTAPAITLAALDGLVQTKDALLLVLPADHVIRDVKAFQAAVQAGVRLAAERHLVTFGVTPTRPETGYGYIQRGNPVGDSGGFAVRHFAEKPDPKTARSYVDSGEYFWNSGMFLFRADTYLEELEAHAPAILEACRDAYEKASDDLDFIRVDSKAFSRCPSDSVDYAVMEHTTRAAMIPLDSDWNDIGSWSALRDVNEQDDAGNVAQGDVITHAVRNSYLRAESRLLTAVGVENLVIVETADAVLVADADQVQDVKRLVERLTAEHRPEVSLHKTVYRPWGSYETLVSAERFQVKRIVVNPGQQLSLQMHHHRAEHWIVVKGTARVTCGEREFTLSEDQSTYIPLGNQHRLANPGVIPLELIEVQSGSYLGEDDIVRFEDRYGRVKS